MPIARKPTMAENQAAAATEGASPEVAANRLRMIFCRDLESSMVTLRRVQQIVKKHGRTEVEAALGEDGSTLLATYEALKTYILSLDPSADVPDLD